MPEGWSGVKREGESVWNICLSHHRLRRTASDVFTHALLLYLLSIHIPQNYQQTENNNDGVNKRQQQRQQRQQQHQRQHQQQPQHDSTATNNELSTNNCSTTKCREDVDTCPGLVIGGRAHSLSTTLAALQEVRFCTRNLHADCTFRMSNLQTRQSTNTNVTQLSEFK